MIEYDLVARDKAAAKQRLRSQFRKRLTVIVALLWTSLVGTFSEQFLPVYLTPFTVSAGVGLTLVLFAAIAYWVYSDELDS